MSQPLRVRGQVVDADSHRLAASVDPDTYEAQSRIEAGRYRLRMCGADFEPVAQIFKLSDNGGPPPPVEVWLRPVQPRIVVVELSATARATVGKSATLELTVRSGEEVVWSRRRDLIAERAEFEVGLAHGSYTVEAVASGPQHAGRGVIRGQAKLRVDARAPCRIVLNPR